MGAHSAPMRWPLEAMMGVQQPVAQRFITSSWNLQASAAAH